MKELEQRLIDLEAQFGGRVEGPKRHASPLDARENRLSGRMQGGDRMATKHKYASIYARHLADRLESVKVLVEVGVFQGSGLAIWCELFPEASIIGLDIDLSHYAENIPRLLGLGAFRANFPSVRTYDQLCPCSLEDVLSAPIDIYIDDGLHTDDAILSSLKHVAPHLAPNATCFLEDTKTVGPKVREAYPAWKVIEYENIVYASPTKGQ